MTLATAPNASLPAGAYRKRPVCDSADAKGHAAGTLLVAPDGHVLLLHRSGVEANFAHHWALPGGGVDDGESPEQGAAREMREEIGHEIEGGKPKLLDQRRTPTGMVFHTFVQPVKQKFAPALNDEHAGFTWAPLDKLPQPIHPAVASTLQDRVGITADMNPEDWQGMRDGFLKWIAEEEREPEHDANGIPMTGDTALTLALDRDSVREYRRDGQMIVKRAHITKANVCPYRGAEIPGWQKLGLDPDRIYQMFRDPDELKKAAPTLNGVQLLFKHVPVNADDHQPHDTVGSLGTDAEFVEEDGENYLDNSLFVNARAAIDGIESKKQHELSAGYHYTPDMTPGNFRGKAYDGVMRDIVFNHVALVEDGRAGPDVVVGDSAENIRMTKPTRLAALALQMTAAAVAPALAMDSKIVLPKDLFTPITSKTFTSQKSLIVDGVRKALNGVKLRPGLAMDATTENVKTVLDALEGVMPEGIDESVSEEQHNAMEAAANGESNIGIPKAVGEEFAEADKGKTFDAAPIAEFLKGKGMGEDDIKTVCDMLPKNGMMAGDADETEEEKAARLEKEKKEKEGAMDTVSKPAMDAALKAQGDAFEKRLAETRKNEQAIRVAITEVKPWIGDIAATMAFDSAADVHRHALKCLKVQDAETLHPDALMPILRTMPKPGARPVETAHSASLAMDSSALATATKYAPDLAGISLG